MTLKKPLKSNQKKDAFLLTNSQLVPYLNFAKQNKRVLKLINQKPQLFQTKNTYQQMYDKIFLPAISQFIDDKNEKIYFLEFFTKGVVAIVHKWIELDCKTEIEDLINIIKKCVNYDI